MGSGGSFSVQRVAKLLRCQRYASGSGAVPLESRTSTGGLDRGGKETLPGASNGRVWVGLTAAPIQRGYQ